MSAPTLSDAVRAHTREASIDETWRADARRITQHFGANLALGAEADRFHALALAGEVGELCNLIKKQWRDGLTVERAAAIAEEIADVQIYLSHLADALGVDINEACARKVAALRQRWPEAFAAPTPHEEPLP